MKGITRYDGPKEGHGWLARTGWGGDLHRKRFADSMWGGSIDAKFQAKAWLLEMNVKIGKPHTNRWIRFRGSWGRGKKKGRWSR